MASARAQDVTREAPAEAAPLGLTEALGLALRRDARFAVVAARARAEEARRAEASLTAMPEVLLGAGLTAGFPGSGSNLQLRGMLGSPFFRTWVAGVDASWNVIDLLRAPRAAGAAEAAAEAVAAAGGVARREVALTLVDLFERALVARERSALLEVEVAARRALLAALRARIDAGALAADQALLAAAGLGDAEAERLAAIADERGARAALYALVGDTRARTAPLAFDLGTSDGPSPEERTARALRRQAVEVRALRALDLAPRVTVAGSVGYANAAPGSDPGYYALGAAVALPLTGAIRDRARRDGEAAALEAQASQADATAQQLATRVAEIDASIEALEAALPAVEAGTRLADQAAEGLAARAAAGVVAPIDVEPARSVQRRARARERTLRVQLEGLRARRSLLRWR